MNKKMLILGGFVALFGGALFLMYGLKNRDTVEPLPVSFHETNEASEEVYVYTIDDLSGACAKDDKIFCAIEQTVKCTLAPELVGCDKDFVPSFVLGKNDTPRPKQISFSITKIKPVPESGDISVYTNSDCDETWFGLCKGTVIYSLTQRADRWAVTNIYAIE